MNEKRCTIADLYAAIDNLRPECKLIIHWVNIDKTIKFDSYYDGMLYHSEQVFRVRLSDPDRQYPMNYICMEVWVL